MSLFLLVAMYQVIYLYKLYIIHPTTFCHLQLFGRAGRDGRAVHGHLFFNNTSLKKFCEDSALKTFCESKENCRRAQLLSSVGNTDSVRTAGGTCCDVCNSSQLPCERLNILKPIPLKRRKRQCDLYDITEDLKREIKECLRDERRKVIQENPSYNMLGPDFVCPDIVIDKL